LFAEEGMFFYFNHSKGAHKLIVGDSTQQYAECEESSVEYRPGDAGYGAAVFGFETVATLTDKSWVTHDFNFEAPDQLPEGRGSAAPDIKPAAQQSWEHHVYGVTSLDKDGLGSATMKRLAEARAAASDAGFEVAHGTASCATFLPGHKFGMTKHVEGDKKYLITEVHHTASDETNLRSGASSEPSYGNRFSCIPETRLAISPLPIQKPFVRGPHTATVVGPKGEEIHTDKHGRIRIQFHWDRAGKHDEKSSCFVRVAQSWAGDGWGSVFIPRIGMEVVVQFLEGDPDRPLVTGAVYNAKNKTPWTLPDEKEKSGVRTRSTPQGAAENANWFLFVDKKGSEKVDIQAEKDFLRTVKNDDTLDVKHDQTRTIKNNRTTTISEGNEKFTIEKGNRDVAIKTGNDTLSIASGARSVTLDKGDHSLRLSAGNQSTTLSQGNQTTTLTAGNLTAELTKGDVKFSCAAGKITLTAMSGITLTCGPSKVELTPQGIKIEGVQIAVKGTAKTDVQGAMVSVSGSGMTNVTGGIVKIN
jgi:type VI secretion system secreted protein VgrG